MLILFALFALLAYGAFIIIGTEQFFFGNCNLNTQVFVWMDTNQDGKRQSSEYPISGILPELAKHESNWYWNMTPTASDGIAELYATYSPESFFGYKHCRFLASQEVSIDKPDHFQFTTPPQLKTDNSMLSFGLISNNNISDISKSDIVETQCKEFPKPPNQTFIPTISISHDQIWFALGGTLGKYNREENNIIWRHDIVIDDIYSIKEFEVLSDNRVWFVRSGSNELYVIEQSGEMRLITELAGVKIDEVRAMSSTPSGDIWFASTKDMLFYDVSEDIIHVTSLTSEPLEDYSTVRDIFSPHDDLVIIRDGNQFSIGHGNPRDTNSFLWEHFPEELIASLLPESKLSSLYVGENGLIWFNKGDSYYNPHSQTWHHPNIREKFDSRELLSNTDRHSFDARSFVPTIDYVWIGTTTSSKGSYYFASIVDGNWTDWPIVRLDNTNKIMWADNNSFWTYSQSAIIRCELIADE